MPNAAAVSARAVQRDDFAGYGFLLPWLLGFLLLTLGPVAASFYLSLTDYSGLSAPNWVGIENYTRIATDDPRFVTAMTVTYLTSTGTDYVAPASITDWGRDAPAPIVGVRIQLTLQGGEANTSTATANTRVQRSFSFNVVLRNRAAWVAPA